MAAEGTTLSSVISFASSLLRYFTSEADRAARHAVRELL
jgi:hypothetical protein